MGAYWQATGGVLLGLVLILSLRSQGKDMGLLLSLFICCGIACLALGYLQPVLLFIKRLQALVTLDNELLVILLKATAVALMGEIASLVCNDAGNSAMAKSLQLLSTAFILWLSLPMLEKLLLLMEDILKRL